MCTREVCYTFNCRQSSGALIETGRDYIQHRWAYEHQTTFASCATTTAISSERRRRSSAWRHRLSRLSEVFDTRCRELIGPSPGSRLAVRFGCDMSAPIPTLRDKSICVFTNAMLLESEPSRHEHAWGATLSEFAVRRSKARAAHRHGTPRRPCTSRRGSCRAILSDDRASGACRRSSFAATGDKLRAPMLCRSASGGAAETDCPTCYRGRRRRCWEACASPS
jgi:hypothetical protein